MTIFKRGVEALRQPDRNPRCYELTDAERLQKIEEWVAQASWNDLEQVQPDNQHYYGA